VPGCTESRRGLPNAPPFGSRERIFFAEEIEHRAPDSVLRVRLELQVRAAVEAVHGLDQADHTGADQIVECDAGRHAALKSPGDVVDEIDVLNDGCLRGLRPDS
jgi:hypothetical protein